jgi:hypothetical protein
MRKEAAFERREAVRVLASARKSELEASSLQAREHVLAWRANALQLALRATIDAQMMREEAALVLSNSVCKLVDRQHGCRCQAEELHHQLNMDWQWTGDTASILVCWPCLWRAIEPHVH